MEHWVWGASEISRWGWRVYIRIPRSGFRGEGWEGNVNMGLLAYEWVRVPQYKLAKEKKRWPRSWLWEILTSNSHIQESIQKRHWRYGGNQESMEAKERSVSRRDKLGKMRLKRAHGALELFRLMEVKDWKWGMEGKEREWGHQALEKFSCEEGVRRKQLERSVESLFLMWETWVCLNISS